MPTLPSVGATGWGTILNAAITSVDDAAKARAPVNVRDYGAVGNGIANDTGAVNAAIAAAGAGVVWFPAGVYNYAGSLALTAATVLDGGGAATLKQTVSTANWIDMPATGGIIRGLTLDANNLATGRIVTAKIDGLIEYCTLKNITNISGVAVRIFAPSGTVVRYNLFDNVATAVYITGGQHVTIERNWIRHWIQRAIYVPTTASAATDHLSILGNRITDMSAGGTVRQPISFQGDAAMLNTNTRINDNVVVGPNASYTAVSNPGTADQISLHIARGFQICRNVSVYGGDLGINLSQDCHGGVVSDNVCSYNENSGINLGDASLSPVGQLSVHGNVCLNNGQDRDGTPPGSAGIRLYHCQDVAVSGNTVGDTQTVHTQAVGITINSSSNIQIGPNAAFGNATGYIGTDGLNTGSTKVSTVAQA